MTESVLLIAPSLEDYRAKARQATMDFFVGLAKRDKRPPTQRSMDALKASEATMTLDPTNDYVSPLLAQEAAIRSEFGPTITAEELAHAVNTESSRLQEIELKRVRASLTIDAATTHLQIHQVLQQFGIII